MTKTIAQQIAEAWGGDGGHLPDDYEEIEERINGGWAYRDTDTHNNARVEYSDGSAIVHCAEYWDIGFTAAEIADPAIQAWVASNFFNEDPSNLLEIQFVCPEVLSGVDPRVKYAVETNEGMHNIHPIWIGHGVFCSRDAAQAYIDDQSSAEGVDGRMERTTFGLSGYRIRALGPE